MKNSPTQQFLDVLDTLNESQRRWYAAREAKRIGRGGITLISKLTGMSRTTINTGINELENSKKLGYENRVRKHGGGRKRLETKNPSLLSLLDVSLALYKPPLLYKPPSMPGKFPSSANLNT